MNIVIHECPKSEAARLAPFAHWFLNAASLTLVSIATISIVLVVGAYWQEQRFDYYWSIAQIEVPATAAMFFSTLLAGASSGGLSWWPRSRLYAIQLIAFSGGILMPSLAHARFEGNAVEGIALAFAFASSLRLMRKSEESFHKGFGLAGLGFWSLCITKFAMDHTW